MTPHPTSRPDEPVLLLSTGARPGVSQLEQLTVAARGRPIRWLAYTRDMAVEHTWELVQDQNVTSAEEVGDPRLSAAVATEAATDYAHPDPVDPQLAAAERAAHRREALRRPARAVVRASIRFAPQAVLRTAKSLPEPVQDALRRIAARPRRGITPGSLLAAAMLSGPLSGYKPALIIALDRAAAAGAWYVVNHRPEITAVNAVDPAVRYLDLAAEKGTPTLQWAQLFGAGQEQDVLAALPALDMLRPRVVLVDVDPAELGSAVAQDLEGPDRDLVVLSWIRSASGSRGRPRPRRSCGSDVVGWTCGSAPRVRAPDCRTWTWTWTRRTPTRTPRSSQTCMPTWWSPHPRPHRTGARRGSWRRTPTRWPPRWRPSRWHHPTPQHTC